MKGVSAIIAIILILMIVVALAALAYTWFSGMFSNLTNSATNATNTATTAMGMQINIEAARINSSVPGIGVNFTIRNTGTVDIDASRLGIYMDGNLYSTYTSTPPGIISPGSTATVNFWNSSGPACGKSLKVTLTSGLEDYRTISC